MQEEVFHIREELKGADVSLERQTLRVVLFEKEVCWMQVTQRFVHLLEPSA